jgi:hypothetical protein
VTLIEIAYRRATQPEAGTLMRLFWIPMDTGKPWPWIGAAALAGIGIFALLRAWPRVSDAWARAGEEMHARA